MKIGIPVIDRFAHDETLRVYYDGLLLFQSGSSWLHPLFELEDYLSGVNIDRRRLYLIDTITGKAAAILVKRMGIRSIYSGIMSRLARDLCERSGISYVAVRVVDRIDCKTESILEHLDDVEEAYDILAQRAGRS